MILYRYINRQLFLTTVVVTFVLVMVLVSGRFIKYLADAAVGDIAADVLFSVMALRFPEFLQMLLPLSLYIGLLLVLGRMYVDSEMTVLNACGVSELKVIRAVAGPVLVTTSLVALFALYVTPHGDAEVTRILEEQQDRSVLELLTPGRFHVRGSRNNHRATYAEGLDREAGVLEGIFLSDVTLFPGEDQSARSLTVRAERGRIIQRDGMNYLELMAGYQYQGQPGDGDFRKATFERALVRIGQERATPRPPGARTAATSALFGDPDPQARAELQWRLSLIAVVPLMAIAAIPLARVNPRQGRFGKLLPAILLYIFYVGLLLFMRDRVADASDSRPGWEHLVWVHAGLLMVIVSLYLGPVLKRRRQVRR